MPPGANHPAAVPGLDLIAGSEQLAWSILESLPGAAFVVVDPDLVVIAAGGKAMRNRGYSRRSMVGCRLGDVIPATAFEAHLPHYRRALAAEVSQLEMTSADGESIYESEFSPLFDAQGAVSGAMMVSRDLTDARHAQAALAAREREFRALAENSTDLLLRCTTDSVIEFASPASETILGIAPEDLVGRSFHDFLHPQDHADIDERRGRVYGDLAGSGGGVVRMEGRIRRGDGSWVWTEATARPVLDESTGEVVGAQCAIRDITDRHDAQQLLVEANERFEQTIANAPIGMALVGVDGTWLEVNQALCEILGHQRDQLLTKTIHEITHPEDLDSDRALIDELLAGDRSSYNIERRYLRADGTDVWTLLTVSMVHGGDGRPLHFIGQIVDISHGKSTEHRLRQQADGDALTGAMNRRRFEEVLSGSIASARRNGGTSALLFIDLDGFKAVNDNHGHQAGDDILKAVAQALASHVRATDSVARHGGDEFVVLLDGVDEHQATQVIDQLLMAIRRIEIKTDDAIVRIDASIGLASINGVGLPNAAAALAAADAAMYAVKTAHKEALPGPSS
jgi:diguanylate cyclase (GGDEF)-like protein/PAS domain S-box-containing protein